VSAVPYHFLVTDTQLVTVAQATTQVVKVRLQRMPIALYTVVYQR